MAGERPPIERIAGPARAPSDGDRHIVVAGTIAAGKTTLTLALSEALGLPAVSERPQANPFLARFYKDRERWALASQLWFVDDSARQHAEIHRRGGAVQDHSIYENLYVFGAVLAEDGGLSADEWTLLRSIAEPIVHRLPPPALVLLVEAPVTDLLERVVARGRLYESEIDSRYLNRLNLKRRELFQGWSSSPVLRIDSRRVDFREHRQVDTIAAVIADHIDLTA